MGNFAKVSGRLKTSAPARRWRNPNPAIHRQTVRRPVPPESRTRFRRPHPQPCRHRRAARPAAHHLRPATPPAPRLPAPLQNHPPRPLRPSVAIRRNTRHVRQPVFQFRRPPARRRQKQRIHQIPRAMAHPVSGLGHPQRRHAPSRVAAAANLLGHGRSHRNAHHPRHAGTRRRNPPLQRLARRVPGGMGTINKRLGILFQAVCFSTSSFS